jgi:hypothetical protein
MDCPALIFNIRTHCRGNYQGDGYNAPKYRLHIGQSFVLLDTTYYVFPIEFARQVVEPSVPFVGSDSAASRLFKELALRTPDSPRDGLPGRHRT